MATTISTKGSTSRKLGFGHRAIFTLVPVQSRTGTNVSIGPGSCGQGPAGPRGGIGPGSSGPFGPSWWDKPGPMDLAPGPPPLVPVGGLNRDQRLPFSPGWWHEPGLTGWSSLRSEFSPTSPTEGRSRRFISPSLSALLSSSQSENRCPYTGNLT